MNEMGSGLVIKSVLAVAVMLGAVSVFANGLFGANKPVTEVAPVVAEADAQASGDINPWGLLAAGAAVALWAAQRRRRAD